MRQHLCFYPLYPHTHALPAVRLSSPRQLLGKAVTLAPWKCFQPGARELGRAQGTRRGGPGLSWNRLDTAYAHMHTLTNAHWLLSLDRNSNEEQ